MKTLIILGEWSAWADGDNLWWPPERCCFEVVVLSETGVRDVRSYSPAVAPHIISGPARVMVRIGDSTWGDNRGKDLQAVLFYSHPGLALVSIAP
jgi:hypothetical protein